MTCLLLVLCQMKVLDLSLEMLTAWDGWLAKYLMTIWYECHIVQQSCHQSKLFTVETDA